MKLFCCADIHSFYLPLKEALDEAGFDSNNPEHWLVVCGDAFDRGDESEEVLHYLMLLERKILIKGNHDILLEECCKREFPYRHDISNGTLRTINDIGGAGEGLAFDECCKRTFDKTAAYRDLLINYFETEKYIFVHSWLPINLRAELDVFEPESLKHKSYSYRKDWREATDSEWSDAMWCNPFERAGLGLNKTGKTIVFGHWHTSWPRHHYKGEPEFDIGADFSPYYGDGYIALDACTAFTGKVNVVVLEDNFINKVGI